jgi:hypothetical protein
MEVLSRDDEVTSDGVGRSHVSKVINESDMVHFAGTNESSRVNRWATADKFPRFPTWSLRLPASRGISVTRQSRYRKSMLDQTSDTDNLVIISAQSLLHNFWLDPYRWSVHGRDLPQSPILGILLGQ